MKNLNEILNEGIFDSDLVSSTSGLVGGWCEDYIYDRYYRQKGIPAYVIDEKHKTIIVQNDYTIELGIDAKNSPFYGFVTGYKFVNKKGKPLTRLFLNGDICGLDNIPDNIDEIHISPNPKTFDVKPQVLKDISSQLKRVKLIEFFRDYHTDEIKFKNLDLTDLKTVISNSLVIGSLEKTGFIKFNPDLKTNIIQFGYDTLGSKWNPTGAYVENLPIFKTITFKSGDFEHVKLMIEGLKDKGKSNFNNIKVNGGDLSDVEKETIKSLLNGQETEYKGHADLFNKLKTINSVINDKDGSKDRFGTPLEVGDIVLVCDSTNSKYPSFLDVYKGGTKGGRIRTEIQMMIPPRNVIKLNNPKILDLLKQ